MVSFVWPRSDCYSYHFKSILIEEVQMEIESLALLALAVVMVVVAGYALYQYLKAYKKILLRPRGR